MKIVIGNTARPFKSGKHWQWTVFAKRPEDLEDNSNEEVSVRLVSETSLSRNHKLKENRHGMYKSQTFNTTRQEGVNKVIFILQSEDDSWEIDHDLVLVRGGSQRNVELEISESSIRRKEIQSKLSQAHFLDHKNPAFWHGRIYYQQDKDGNGINVRQPGVAWKSNLRPREDHSTSSAGNWLTASEYLDHKSTMEAKVDQLAELLKLSKNTVIYSGAGISRAAGIGQAARSGSGGGNKTTTAQPTKTHCALTALANHGYITGGWLQQNHDGLPQKAGFPQSGINEIHGSWYDPSNPVVKYDGSLKTEQYQWMLRQIKEADLVLVLGTSLSGLNADQVATRAAARSSTGKPYRRSGALGTVIINLQQTPHDGETTLRIFGKTDDVFDMLLERMHIPLLQPPTMNRNEQRYALVPYDRHGQKVSENANKMWLDLRPGAKVKITPGHNTQGSKQPDYVHIQEKKCSGKVVSWNTTTRGINLAIEGVPMTLGSWWLEAAMRGEPSTLPIVNAAPKFEDVAL